MTIFNRYYMIWSYNKEWIEKMKIGLMGFEFSSANKGCEALVYSFLDIIKGVLTTSDIVYNFSGTELGYVPEYFDGINFINVYPKLKDFKFKYIRFLKECDIVFDVTMGDSFSDIYSKKYYNYLIIHKKISQLLCKKYILLPQTYGPFKEMGSAEKAIKVFRNSAKIYCRDEISQKLLSDKFNITNSELVSDMAFVLPYDKKMYDFSDKEKIGINVSGLLYKGGFNEANQFDLSLNYKKLMDKILSTLSTRYEVHLIPHVIDLKEDAYDDDYKICKILQEKYPETILAPAFNTPIEAKSYISNMKIFVGSRMHSTIAAFSSGVVTIPISYSRKFEGLFNSLSYEYVINGKEESTESAYFKILQYIENFDKLRNIQERSLKIIKEKNDKFSNSIRNVLANS